jgi:hypothetical protein
MDNLIVPSTKVEISLESLKDKPRQEKPEIKADKIELSENIKKFDNKKRIASPYDYNIVALNKKHDYTPTAEELILSPVHNSVGKFLGIDTIHDWGQHYDKVGKLVEWAKTKTGKDDINSIMDFLNQALNAAPSFGMNHRRIDQLYMYAKLNMEDK